MPETEMYGSLGLGSALKHMCLLQIIIPVGAAQTLVIHSRFWRFQWQGMTLRC